MATKSKTEIVLDGALGIKNIFVNDWKPHFLTDNKKRIASIPFMRNLIEYTRGTADADYIKLTSLLHWKADSGAITQQTLYTIYQTLFGPFSGALPDPNAFVIDLIAQEAKECLKAGAGVNFENKIVLAIAIRIAAERFIAAKLADPAALAGISENQTQALLKKFQQAHGSEIETIRTLRKVVLMTPENIHLNAFMYEPILDMSDEHLRKLYTDVSALK
jgi:hypothetical protein